ncbi:peroxisomal membrane anchor protein [Microthyrium microscopicum]|uniref:Peroxisomal membrane protein PEX14 n=1 Tax=Microthyrium microscopicum TaxID=703497 RepID=A0A6A6UMR1_9PEZI|nr:peroxisomal membrane anchor protein [Microthyrium microscopicum]
MVREDLVNSAASPPSSPKVLQDPSVASAPLDKRIAFLESKNLTKDEVNVALARAGGPNAPPSNAPVQQQNYAYTGQQQAPPPGYGPYPGYWQQPPPERDWRDWFIMATVMGGVGFGLYVTAKRYILPMIKPPTPPQLTQDKESIDESFTKAFGLLDSLETDTKALKEAEEARTSRLDGALSELEAVIASLKDSDRKREDDARRNTDEIRMLRDLIPKALESEKSATETRLRELTNELKSLKTLMGNRMGPTTSANSYHRPTPSQGNSATQSTPTNGTASSTNGVSSPTTETPSVAQPTTVDAATGADSAKQPEKPASPAAASSSFPRFGTGKAAIPAWQLAAKNSSENIKTDTSTSGTAVEDKAVGAS